MANLLPSSSRHGKSSVGREVETKAGPEVRWRRGEEAGRGPKRRERTGLVGSVVEKGPGGLGTCQSVN